VPDPSCRLQINESEAAHLLSRHFNGSVSAVSPMMGGQTALAFSFAANGERYVIRFSFNKYGLYKDKYAYEHFHSDVRPIPKTISIAQHSQSISYSITEMAQGKELYTYPAESISGGLKSRLVDFIIGNRTTALPGSNFGRWDDQGDAFYPTWQSYLRSLNETVENNLDSLRTIFSDDQLERIQYNYNRLIDFCPDVRQLIHGDFSKDNIFTDGKKITALVDWDNSMYGDALYDLAWASFWEERMQYESVYNSRTVQVGFSEQNLTERLQCYKMHGAISSLCWYMHSGQPNHDACLLVRDRLARLVSNLPAPSPTTRHFYQKLDRPHFDYDLQQVDGLGEQLFRGPEVDLTRPYIVCVGAAQTFGRFCHRPFPAILAEGLQHQVLNLGVGGAGPRFFDRPEILEILNRAQLVVIQALSARSEGNSLFDNSRTGSLLGTRLADGQEMRFESFLSDLMQAESRATVQQAVQETRDNYVRHMADLLDGIRVPKVLLWLSAGSPDRVDDYSAPFALLGPFPQLVNRAMVDALRPHCDAYVECVSQAGIPQQLWPCSQPIDGTELDNGLLVNRYYPSPEMHAEAASKLVPQCLSLLKGTGRAEPLLATDADELAAYRPFLVVCAERTGSNLLLGLLRSHEEVFAGGELFNPVLIEDNLLAWSLAPQEDLAELNALRRSDPIAFLRRLFAMAARNGHRMIGFKLMYGHGDQQVRVRDYLAANRELRVVHLKRRNLLRRHLSEERARITGEWATKEGAAAKQLPTLDMDFRACLANFAFIEQKQADYDALFHGHPLLELFYEDLSEDPQAVGARVLSFLGVEGTPKLAVDFARTGIDPLRSAIANYDELKSKLQSWAGFFTD
jgi:LPS sulfotransferase NodH/aminoglycoside phosphotransferase (APT) family kinase protein